MMRLTTLVAIDFINRTLQLKPCTLEIQISDCEYLVRTRPNKFWRLRLKDLRKQLEEKTNVFVVESFARDLRELALSGLDDEMLNNFRFAYFNFRACGNPKQLFQLVNTQLIKTRPTGCLVTSQLDGVRP